MGCVRFILKPPKLVTQSLAGAKPLGIMRTKGGVSHHVFVDVGAFACNLGGADVFILYGGHKLNMGDPRYLIERELWGLVGGQRDKGGDVFGVDYATAEERDIDKVKELIAHVNSPADTDFLRDTRDKAVEELKRQGVEHFVPAIMELPRSPGYAIRTADALHHLPLGVFRTLAVQRTLHIRGDKNKVDRIKNKALADRLLARIAVIVDILAQYFSLAPKGLGLDDQGAIRAKDRRLRDMLTAVAFRESIAVKAKDSPTGQAFVLELRPYGAAVARFYDWEWLLFRPVQSASSLNAIDKAATTAVLSATDLMGTEAMSTLKVSMMRLFTIQIPRLGHVDATSMLLGESAQGELKALNQCAKGKRKNLALTMASASEARSILSRAHSVRDLPGDDSSVQAPTGLLQRCLASHEKTALSPPPASRDAPPRIPLVAIRYDPRFVMLRRDRPRDARALRALPAALSRARSGAEDGSVQVFLAGAVVAKEGEEEGKAIAIRPGMTVEYGGTRRHPTAGAVPGAVPAPPAQHALVHAVVSVTPAGAAAPLPAYVLVRRFQARAALDRLTRLEVIEWAAAGEEAEEEEEEAGEGEMQSSRQLPESYECVPLASVTGCCTWCPNHSTPTCTRGRTAPCARPLVTCRPRLQ